MNHVKVIVGMGSCGLASGAGKIYDILESLRNSGRINCELSVTSCIGMCYKEPLLDVIDSRGSVTYGEVDESRILEIVDRHILRGEVIQDWIVRSDFLPGS